MAAGRMVLRKTWKDGHPAQFNRSRRVLALGRPVRPRLSFGLWKLKTFHPERYAELVKLANRDAKKAEKELEQHATDEARAARVEVQS